MSAEMAVGRAAERAVGAVALAAGAAYVLGAAPGIHVWDTAELATAAHRLGPSHPPGQPLYTILGKLAMLLPLGSIAFRANVLSAVTAALAVWLTGRVAIRWSDPRAPGDSAVAGLAAAIAFAVSGPLVNQATRAEVYAPAVLLFLLAAHEVTRAVAGPRATVPPLVAAGLAAGLAATLHPVAGLSAGIAGLVAVAVLQRRLLRAPRVWLLTLAALIGGVLPLGLIVLRCRGDLEPCWEAHMTPLAFWRYVTGASFRHNLQTGQAALETVADAMRYAVVRSGVLPVLVLVAAAALSLRRRSPAAARVALAVVVAIAVPFAFLVMQPFHPDNPDTQGYLLPTLALLFASAAPSALAIGARWRRGAGIVLALAVTAAAALSGDARASVRPHAYLPGDVGARALGEPHPKALVVAGTDAVFFAMQYGQLVEGLRPDVALMASGLANTERQWRDAARRRPEVVLERARPGGHGDLSLRWAHGALDLVRGTLPCWVEDPLFDVNHVRSTGILFQLDAEAGSAALPRFLEREHAPRRASYADGTDSMLRLLYLRRALDREAHGEMAAAAGELRRGLWEERHWLDRRLRDFVPALELRTRPLTPLGYQGWVLDAGTLRAVLARVLYRGGRTDLAVSVLERDFRAGNPQAALVLAEIELREGRTAEAEALYRAFANAHPARRGYALVGLALVRATRGDRDGAFRQLRRVVPGADPVLKMWTEDVAAQVIPVLAPVQADRP